MCSGIKSKLEIFFSGDGDSIKITFAPYFFPCLALILMILISKWITSTKTINVWSVFTNMAIIKHEIHKMVRFSWTFIEIHICGWSESNPLFRLLNNHHHHLRHNHNLKNHFSIRLLRYLYVCWERKSY